MKTISEYDRSRLNRLVTQMAEGSSCAFYDAFKNHTDDIYLYAYSSLNATRVVAYATLQATNDHIEGEMKQEIEKIIDLLQNIDESDKNDYPTKFAHLSLLLFNSSKHLKSILK